MDFFFATHFVVFERSPVASPGGIQTRKIKSRRVHRAKVARVFKVPLPGFTCLRLMEGAGERRFTNIER